MVDKPSGWTSHDVVARTRNILGIKKVGHAGTLDPMATGVLVLMAGTATKLSGTLSADRKRYLAEVTFGRATDTYDAEGATTSTGDPGSVDLQKLAHIIENMQGILHQMPPMYSAVKVKGRKLYQLARQGKTVERKPRVVEIYSIVADLSGFPVIQLDIECSKGTYIRTIAHELGENAGCPAHLSALRRTRSGDYTIDEAVDFLIIANSDHPQELERYLRPALEPETEHGDI